MKKKWMFCLSAVLLTFAACSDDEKGTDEQPCPIIGEWVFEKNEVYRNGKLAESFTAVETADKMIAIFREDGTYRYYDYPPKEYYNGTYTYEESTKTLSMRSDDVDYSDGSDPQVCHAEVTTTRMTWTYPADEDGYVTVEYYVRR